MFNDNENPYAPPSCPGCGEYDWSLAKRVFLTFSAIAGFCLLCSAILWWSTFDQASAHLDLSVWEQVKAFLFDWKSIR